MSILVKPSANPFGSKKNEITQRIKGITPCPSSPEIIRLHHLCHPSASVYSGMFYQLVLR